MDNLLNYIIQAIPTKLENQIKKGFVIRTKFSRVNWKI